jgi:protein LTV1
VGEAAIYGIYYDDTEYDYMQHLRPVGTSEEGVESLLIEAPAAPKQVPRPKNKSAITLKDIPSEALASTTELERNYESQQAIPSSIAGFQPDMDPHLRQVLEALEDDAFVDDGLEDDFFGELVKDGERKPDEVIEFEFEEDGELEEDGEGEDHGEEAEDNWEARFAQFKISQKETGNHTSERDGQSEGGDTVGRLPQLSVVGGKRRRKGASDASGYSMSSSSMFRNAGLTALDDQFDQVSMRYFMSSFTTCLISSTRRLRRSITRRPRRKRKRKMATTTTTTTHLN